MNRYKFTSDSIEKAKRFLRGKLKQAPTWAKRYKDDLKIKSGDIYYKDRKIVPVEKVRDVLRDEIYKKDSDIPPSRDAAFHICKSRYVGISRREIMKFLAGQRTLAETKPIPAQAKRKAGKPLKGFGFETDLIFVKKDDVHRSAPSFIRKDLPDLQYIVCTTEKITGLTRLSLVAKKDAAFVTPIVKKQLTSLCKQLKTKPSEVTLSSDKGGEFDAAQLRAFVKTFKHIARGSHVENRNRQAQSNLYRVLAARKAKTLESAVSQSEKLMNNTVNRIQKKTPNESASLDEKDTLKTYNKSRKAHVSSTKRELQVGDHVRNVSRLKLPQQFSYTRSQAQLRQHLRM